MWTSKGTHEDPDLSAGAANWFYFDRGQLSGAFDDPRDSTDNPTWKGANDQVFSGERTPGILPVGVIPGQPVELP